MGLVVVGDGSAKRTEQAPGHVDADAGPFDEEVAAALAAVDVGGLLGLEPGRARRLMAEGRAPWQLAAGAVRAVGAAAVRWRGEVTYDEAPYGVGYLVASWRRG